MLCEKCIHYFPIENTYTFDCKNCLSELNKPHEYIMVVDENFKCDEYTPKLNLKNRGSAPMDLTGISLTDWFKSN